MAFRHEKLDAYRAAVEYAGWAYRFCDRNQEIDPDTDTDSDPDQDRNRTKSAVNELS